MMMPQLVHSLPATSNSPLGQISELDLQHMTKCLCFLFVVYTVMKHEQMLLP